MAKTSTSGRVGKTSGARKGKPSIPKILYAQVSPHSVGGMSMFDVDGFVDTDVVANFVSEDHVIMRAAQGLQDDGFEVLQRSPYTINIAAPIKTYERAFKTKIAPHELDTLKGGGVKDTAR